MLMWKQSTEAHRVNTPETKSKEKNKVCISAITPSPSLYLHYLKHCSGLHGPGWGEWGWTGVQFGPGKGLMTHVWTNGSQWSYLLIQPHYFTSIKYVCPDRSLLPPSPNASQQHANQRECMRFPDFLCFSSPTSDTPVTLKQASLKNLHQPLVLMGQPESVTLLKTCILCSCNTSTVLALYLVHIRYCIEYML